MRNTEKPMYFKLLACVGGLAVLSGMVSAQENSPGEEELIIKVFFLSNAAASDASDMVDGVFGDALVGMAADKRTNSLVVRARKSVAEELEALLMELDSRAGQDPPLPPKSALDRPGGSATQGLEIRSEIRRAATVKKLIPNGTKVNKGDLLVELDDSQLMEDLRTRRVEIEKLKAGELFVKEQNSAAGPSEAVEIDELQLRVAELYGKQVAAEIELEQVVIEGEISLAKKTLEIVEASRKRLEELAKTGRVSSDEVPGVALEAAKAETSLEVAVAKRKLLVEVARPLRLAEAELKLVQARTNFDRVKREAERNSEQARANLAALRAELKLKTAQIAMLEKQIARCRITAPHSGVVRIGQPSVIKEGAIVREGQPLVYLEKNAPPSR